MDSKSLRKLYLIYNFVIFELSLPTKQDGNGLEPTLEESPEIPDESTLFWKSKLDYYQIRELQGI